MTWQPIETAPHSTPLMLFYEKLGVRYGFYDDVGTGDWWVADFGAPGKDAGWFSPYFDLDGMDPTHWMPVPAPPQFGPRRIQRKRVYGWRMPANTVYVGRPSKWGNPYVAGAPHPYDHENQHGTLSAKAAVDSYRDILPHLPGVDLTELRGKNLACWCPLDSPCHADVLLELANKP